MARDEFRKEIVTVLAKRVACRCSRPACRRVTAGPHSDPGRFVNIGVASHITAASPGGPRYDARLTSEQRSDVSNGIWLCQSCSKTVDNDPKKFPAHLLRRWKRATEAETQRLLLSGQTGIESETLLRISAPIRVGMRSNCQVGKKFFPLAGIVNPDLDPTIYGGAQVFRFILAPVIPDEIVVVQGIGAEIAEVKDVPNYAITFSVYPTAISLYQLAFDTPTAAGTNRFMAERYFKVRIDDKSIEYPFQPVALDPILPETFDIRLAPKNAGFFTMRLFVIASSGIRVVEQDLIANLKVVVPSNA